MPATATKAAASAKQSATDGRDTRGRFAPGNAGGPGNPFARKVAQLRKALVNFITDEDMKEVALILKEKAKMGNLEAIKLLYQYVLGKPAAAVDPDRLDVDEWQKLQEQARPPAEMSQVMNGIPAQTACDVTRIAWPCAVETNFAGPFRAQLQAVDERDAQRAASTKRKAKDAPMTNGDNGDLGLAPMANGPNGAPDDWLTRFAQAALAERPSPNRRNGKAARRKAKRRR